MKAILKNYTWKKFLENNPSLLSSLWDLLPKEVEIVEIEEMVWVDQYLYHFKFENFTGTAWEDEFEEFISD